MTDYTPDEKHLEFIQNTITRMGQNSFQAKAWGISIVSALLAFMLSQSDHKLKIICIVIAIVVTLLFCLLDVYYLFLERGYRSLYNSVAGLTPNHSVKKYDMKIPAEEKGFGKYVKALFSVSTGIFYSVVIIGLIIMIIVI